jgi:hypothetical protein
MLAAAFLPGRASANELTPPVPGGLPAPSSSMHLYPPGPRPTVPDDGTFWRQILVGEAAAIAAPAVLVVALGAAKADTVPTVATIALGTPLAVGGVVCAIGKHSAVYEGSCLAPIGGAMVASLATVGLVALAERRRDPDSDVGLGPAMLLFAGWLIAEPALAIAGWRVFRTVRPAPAPDPRTALAVPDQPRRGLVRLSGERTVTLLSFAF